MAEAVRWWPLRLQPGDDLRRTLEAAVAAQGRVFGGHAGYGCTVRTTAEVLLALLPAWHFTREADPSTGYAELVVRPRWPGARQD
jgi:predicted DNA-binding protein with PD1-like motif